MRPVERFQLWPEHSRHYLCIFHLWPCPTGSAWFVLHMPPVWATPGQGSSEKPAACTTGGHPGHTKLSIHCSHAILQPAEFLQDIENKLVPIKQACFIEQPDG